MVLHRNLCDSKSPQVPWTLLGILADFTYSVVKKVSTSPIISMSSSPYTNPLVTVQRAPITIGIIDTCIIQIFFQLPSR